MYSDDAEFWHPLFVVKGKENIFGAHMFWSFINRKTHARVKRLGVHLCCLQDKFLHEASSLLTIRHECSLRADNIVNATNSPAFDA